MATPDAVTAERGPWAPELMVGLVVAELRKALSTSGWWALLIPAALVGFLVTMTGAVAGSLLSFSLSAALAVALDISATFALIFGVLVSAGEFRHRTITTSYVTGAGRTQVLLAKMLAAAALAAFYGVAAATFGLAGAVVGGGRVTAGDLGSAAAVTLVGVAVFALWAVLGVGLGALIPHQLGAITGALLFILIGESFLSVALSVGSSQEIAHFLPRGAASLAISDVAGPSLLGGTPFGVDQPPWWLALLVFTTWASAVAALGAVAAERRDIT